MASTTITPPVEAAPAAAAATTAAPSTAAPVTTSTETPVVGSAEFFESAIAETTTEAEALSTEVKPPVDETAAAVVPDPAAPAETPEQKTARETAVAAEATKAKEPAVNQQEIDLGVSIAPDALLKTFDSAPDVVKAWMNEPAQAEFKNTLVEMSKRAAIADPILRLIPDAETAQEVVGTSAKFHEFDDAFLQIAKPEDAQNFWTKMYEDFAIVGADGKKQMNPVFSHIERSILDTNINRALQISKESGQLHPYLSNVVHQALDLIFEQAGKEPTEDNKFLQAAITEFRNARPNVQPKAPELTPEQKTKQAELDRREAEAATRDTKTREADFTKFSGDVDRTVAQSAFKQFAPHLKELSPFEKTNAAREIGVRVLAELNKHEFYKNGKARLVAALKKSPTQENAQALQAHEIKYQNMKLGPIVSQVLKEATKGTIKRTTELLDKTEEQKEASKSEPSGAGTGVAKPAAGSYEDSRAQAQAAWDAIPGNKGTKMDEAFYWDWEVKASAPK